MKIVKLKKAFTLIELLVVITIIGILATGGVSVYTTQIKKARDSSRLSDLNSVKGALEQYFLDTGFYPHRSTAASTPARCNNIASIGQSKIDCIVVNGYLNALPSDPKHNVAGNGGRLLYVYQFGTVDGVANQAYEVSAAVEGTTFRTQQAVNSEDGGNDANRVELGFTGNDLRTCTNGASNCTTNSTNSSVTAASCRVASTNTNAVVINGNC